MNEIDSASSASSETWMARASLYELLSFGLLVPTRELAGALSAGDFAEACEEAAQGCGFATGEGFASLEGYAGSDPEVLFHELRCEYTRLFAKAPEPLVVPYVGVYQERLKGTDALLFVNPESMAIERFMRRCGVVKDLSVGQSNDPVDHIGTVCEFLKYLCLVNAQAVRPAKSAEVHDDDYGEFHRKHFAEYALWCSNRIRESGPSAFYRFVAEALALAAQDA